MKKKMYLISFYFVLSSFVLFGQNVSTYIGTGEKSGTTQVSVNRTDALLNQPYNMAFDKNGNLWITENGNHTITMMKASDQSVKIVAGTATVAGFYNNNGVSAKFSSPMGIVAGPNNEIYVADNENHVIRKISAFKDDATPLTVTVLAGKHDATGSAYISYPGFADGVDTIAQFKNPSDLAMDAAGNLYVADYGNHIIRKIMPDGTVSTFAGKPGVSGKINGNALNQATFKNPVGLCIAPNGDIYVADKGNNLIRKISNGMVSTVVPFGANNPIDVLAENDSNIYISSDNEIKLSYITSSSSGITIWSGSSFYAGYADGALLDARYKLVQGLVYDKNGLMYIADMNNHVIRKVQQCQSAKPKIQFSGDPKICMGDSVVLKAPSGFNSYKWSNGQTGASVTIKETGQVYFIATDSEECSSVSDTISIIALEPIIIVDGDTGFCKGDSLILESFYSYDSYNWSNGKKTRAITIKESGIYNVTLTYKTCIQKSGDIIVNVYDVPDKPVITVTGKKLTSTEAHAYQWYKNNTVINGANDRDYMVTSSGNYKVAIFNMQGCDAFSDVVNIDVSAVDEVKNIKTSLYPNPANHQFSVVAEGTDNFIVEVYNNQGSLLYKTNAVNNSQINVNMEGFPKGLYLVRIYSGQEVFLNKLLLY